jgi:hypothetical protein
MTAMAIGQIGGGPQQQSQSIDPGGVHRSLKSCSVQAAQQGPPNYIVQFEEIERANHWTILHRLGQSKH